MFFAEHRSVGGDQIRSASLGNATQAYRTVRATSGSRDAKPPSRGITLIETVIGMALLATLLVSFLLAFQRHRQHVQLAHARLEAADVAEQILATWMSRETLVPRATEGTWDHDWSWRTQFVRRQYFHELPFDVLALEVRRGDSDGDDPTMIRVEFVDGAQPIP